MRLNPGEEAPPFEAKTLDGTPLALSQHKGELVWLAFFRYAMCPLCCYRIHELIGLWQNAYAPKKFVMYGVFQSPVKKLEDMAKRYATPFTIIPDPEMEIFKTYRVEARLGAAFGGEVFSGVFKARKAGIPVVKLWDGPPTRVPADFLIDREGKIGVAHYGANVAQSIPFEQVDTWLDAEKA